MQFYNWLLFSFKGRINRRTYWAFYISAFFISQLLLTFLASHEMTLLFSGPDAEATSGAILDYYLNSSSGSLDLPHEKMEALESLISTYWTIYIISLFPKLAIDVKRFQDRNRSWHWVLIQLIPMIGPIWYLVETGVMPGTRGPNRFGNPMGKNDNGTSPPPEDQGRFEA